jgi:hypothetical protein
MKRAMNVAYLRTLHLIPHLSYNRLIGIELTLNQFYSNLHFYLQIAGGFGIVEFLRKL